MTNSRKIVATICSVLVGLTEIAEHVEVIREHLPPWAQMHSQDLIVAILLSLSVYLMATHGEKESLAESSGTNVNATTGKATATASPIIGAGQKIEQTFNFSPHSPPKSIAPTRPATPQRAQHNVKYTGLKTIPPNTDAPLMVVGCFQNVLIPHTSVSNFLYAKVKITYFNSEGTEIGEIYPAVWAESEDDSPLITLEGGVTHSIVVAAYVRTKWSACWFRKTPNSWGEDIYAIEEEDLPMEEDIRAVIVLFGEKNVSLAPVTLLLNLAADGVARVTQL